MNFFNTNNAQLDRDYYISLAIETLGANIARRLNETELVIVGKGIDAEIVESKLKELKVA